MQIVSALIALLAEAIKATSEKATPRGVVITTLTIATILALAIVVAACGAINYQPIEKSTLTIEHNIEKDKDNGKANETH